MTPNFLFPFPGVPEKDFRLTQGFGGNKEIYSRFGLVGHNGLDFAGPKPGEKILSFFVADGTIIRVGYDEKGFGNFIRYVTRGEDGKDYEITHAHLDSYAAKFVPGQKVLKGTPAGVIGNTGFSKGVHLHFQVREMKNGAVVNYGNGFKGAIDPTPLLTVAWSREPRLEAWQEQALEFASLYGISNGTRPLETATRVEVLEMLRKFHSKFLS